MLEVNGVLGSGYLCLKYILVSVSSLCFFYSFYDLLFSLLELSNIKKNYSFGLRNDIVLKAAPLVLHYIESIDVIAST